MAARKAVLIGAGTLAAVPFLSGCTMHELYMTSIATSALTGQPVTPPPYGYYGSYRPRTTVVIVNGERHDKRDRRDHRDRRERRDGSGG